MANRNREYVEFLKQKFNEEKYIEFISDLLNLSPEDINSSMNELKPLQKQYKEKVEYYKFVANYTVNSDKIGTFIVKLTSDGSQNARANQRTFISTLLKKYNLDASLVAFYRDDEPSWRLSFVKKELSFTDKGIKIDLTPAKRYSYLVGENESVHTAQEYLLTLLNIENRKITLSDIERVFDVEKVTNKFFEQYKEKYLQLKDYLENNDDFITESISCDFTSEEFAKKLLGQIIFLYFLQKKGWLGVEIVPEKLNEDEYIELSNNVDSVSNNLLEKYFIKDNNIYKLDKASLKKETIKENINNFVSIFKGKKYDKPWGSGDKKFVRTIFNKSRMDHKNNFFDDYLEPFFYTGLNENRDNKYFPLFNCKIPFLNGGLFEPLNNYRWSSAVFNIPDEMFSNEEKNGILDTFDLYNFTIDEEEPLEKDIAVDPEMLGKIFEKLLDDNNENGTFYTPRDIVHYMCQESIAEYLSTNLNIPYDDIINFIKYGDMITEYDWDNIYNNDKVHVLPDTIWNKILEVDKLLVNIKIADPAVGSGAFPLGMLNEIVKIRDNLSSYIIIQRDKGLIDIEDYDDELNNRDLYSMKLQTIQNSIYAVDLEISAVDIAKLRLWLSLIVDFSNECEPKPLPNLDCKIMQGNSLLDEYEGVPLFSEKELDNNLKNYRRNMSNSKYIRDIAIQQSLVIDENDTNYDEFLTTMLKLQKEYFITADNKSKKDLKEKIDNIQLSMVQRSLINKPDKLESFNNIAKKKSKPWFIWKLEFFDVFKNNGGFDIVIGNPPYGANIDELVSVYGKKYPETSHGYKDIYKYFFNIAMRELLNENGILCYITPNTYFKQPRYKDLREYLLNYRILKLINLGADVFDASVLTAIIIISKDYNHNNYIEMADLSIDSKYNGKINDFELTNIEQKIFYLNSDYSFVAPYYVLKDNDIPFHKLIIAKDAGINYQRVSVGLKEKGKSDLSSRLLYEGGKINLNDIEYWKGIDINQFYISPSSSRFCRPYIVLKENERIVLNKEYFSIKPKLLWRQTAPYPICAIDNRGIWFGRSIQAGIISPEYKDSFKYEYVCCLMNSNYLRFLYSKFVEEDGRLFPQVKLEKLSNLPFKKASIVIQKEFLELYYKIIKGDKNALNNMNSLVYELYEVSQNEIMVIESFFNHNNE